MGHIGASIPNVAACQYFHDCASASQGNHFLNATAHSLVARVAVEETCPYHALIKSKLLSDSTRVKAKAAVGTHLQGLPHLHAARVTGQAR